MSSLEIKQDLPPPGGYKPINYKRVPAKSYFGGYTLIGAYLGMTTFAAYIYYLNYKAVKARELEMRSASLAIYPMLLAERDRAYLKQLRKNREEERDLMKNVEGWEVGTWYGKPLYKTLKKDEWVDPDYHEYYIHASYKEYNKRADLLDWA